VGLLEQDRRGIDGGHHAAIDVPTAVQVYHLSQHVFGQVGLIFTDSFRHELHLARLRRRCRSDLQWKMYFTGIFSTALFSTILLSRFLKMYFTGIFVMALFPTILLLRFLGQTGFVFLFW
jgi:hypothetical protein